jgi:hypothetical protein
MSHNEALPTLLQKLNTAWKIRGLSTDKIEILEFSDQGCCLLQHTKETAN